MEQHAGKGNDVSETSDISPGREQRRQLGPVPSPGRPPADRSGGEVLPRAGGSNPVADPRAVAERGRAQRRRARRTPGSAAAEGLESSRVPALVWVRRGATRAAG